MNNGLRILLELSLSGPASFVILWVLVFTLAMVCTSVLVYLRSFKTKSEGIHPIYQEITEFLTVPKFFTRPSPYHIHAQLCAKFKFSASCSAWRIFAAHSVWASLAVTRVNTIRQYHTLRSVGGNINCLLLDAVTSPSTCHRIYTKYRDSLLN